MSTQTTPIYKKSLYEIAVERTKRIIQTEKALKSAAKAYRNARKDLERAETTEQYKACVTAILTRHAILGEAAISYANAEDEYTGK